MMRREDDEKKVCTRKECIRTHTHSRHDSQNVARTVKLTHAYSHAATHTHVHAKSGVLAHTDTHTDTQWAQLSYRNEVCHSFDKRVLSLLLHQICRKRTFAESRTQSQRFANTNFSIVSAISFRTWTVVLLQCGQKWANFTRRNVNCSLWHISNGLVVFVRSCKTSTSLSDSHSIITRKRLLFVLPPYESNIKINIHI